MRYNELSGRCSMEYVNNFWSAFSLTLLAGLSTGIGAALAFFTRANNHTILSVGMGFSAGVMVYISFVEILDKSRYAFESLYGSINGELLTLLAFFGGFALSFAIDRLIPDDVNPHELRQDRDLAALKTDADAFLNHAMKKSGDVITSYSIHYTKLYDSIKNAIGVSNFALSTSMPIIH